jgi:hypothetical protein
MQDGQLLVGKVASLIVAELAAVSPDDIGDF